LNYIKTLSLNSFRNYPTFSQDFCPVPVVFYGHNGAGKTNLLEALSLFSVGSELRKAKNSERGYHGSSCWGAQIQLNDGVKIATGITRLGRRIFKIQGEPTRSVSEISAFFRVLSVSPEIDFLFVGPSSDRRHLFNQFVTAYNPLYAEHLSAYEQATSQRLALLKKEEPMEPRWLDSLEKIMIQEGLALSQIRHTFVQLLNDGQPSHFSVFPCFSCKLVGKWETLWEDSSFEMLAALLNENRCVDKSAGMTTLGCHRSDWEITSVEKQRAARLCSMGEQKILFLSVFLSFLAQIQQKTTGFLLVLLDDIVSHLDSQHRMLLFEQMGRFCAISSALPFVHFFLSGVERAYFDALKGAQFFKIEKACLQQEF
jgi:DNA replication and repair protein RecF